MWIPEEQFYVRVAPDVETKDRDVVCKHVAEEFMKACGLPLSTPVQVLTSIEQFDVAQHNKESKENSTQP